MLELKSRGTSLKILLIISIVVFILTLFFKNNLDVFEIKVILFLLLLSNLIFPILLIKKRLYQAIKVIIISELIYLPLFIYFREIRNLFPKPIMNSDWVGFANYFKYPLAFDTFFFFCIILIPVFAYLVVSKYENKNK